MQKKPRFEELFLPQLDAAYNLAYWIAGGEADAQDIVATHRSWRRKRPCVTAVTSPDWFPGHSPLMVLGVAP